jgi:hypothetical protein
MNDVEERLRHSLARHAGAAPRGDRMLANVRRESGRRRRNRLTALAAGTVMSLVLAIAGTVAVAGAFTGSTSYTPAGSGPEAPATTFVAGAPVDATFPFTPRATGIGGDSPPALSILAGRPTLRYPAGAGANPLTVTVGGADWAAGLTQGLTDARQVKVRGRIGTLGDRAEAAERVLFWTDGTDRWVELSAPLPTTTTALIDYADGLADQPMTQPGPLGFDLVPSGFTVDNLDASTVTFCPPGIAPSADFGGKLVVYLEDGQATAQDGQSVSVGDRTGRIHSVDGVTVLRVNDGATHSLVVQAPTALGIARPDLLRFAAGIHPTAGAVFAKG